MLIDHGRGLGTAVAVDDVEIESGDAMLAEGALERDAAVHRFGRVISHNSILVLLLAPARGNRCATLE